VTNVAGQLVTVISGFVIGVLVSRLIGVEGRGEIYFVLATTSLGLMMGTLGLPASNIFLLAKKEYDPKQIFGNAFVLSVLSGGLLFVMGVVYVQYAGNSIRGIDAGLLIVGILSVPLLIIFSNISSILQGLGNTLLYNKLIIFTQLIGSCSLIAVIISTRSAYGYIVTTVLIALVNLVVLFVICRKLGITSFGFNRELFSNQIAYAMQLYASNILTHMVLRIDVFLVNYYLGVKALGYYSLAVAVCETILILPFAIGTMLFPRASSLTHGEMRGLVSAAFRHTLLITMVMAVLLIFASDLLITVIYGRDFRPAVPATVFLAPSMVAMGALSVSFNGIASLGTNRVLILVPAVGLAVNVILNLMLLPAIGVIGASIAATVTYWLELLLSFGVLYRLLGLKVKHYVVFQKEDFAVYRRLIKRLASLTL
jgi:O-antigen/teichoic acid export membrane protein